MYQASVDVTSDITVWAGHQEPHFQSVPLRYIKATYIGYPLES